MSHKLHKIFLIGLIQLIAQSPALAGLTASNKNKMQKPNHLINEKSPYLLQHAYNPVDWYPWGPEAFEKARRENKPILVSIGYSTCHWCHVMERESFSDPKIAAIMNQYLVSIKVDREERPDVDKIYMTAVSAMTGSGGWPLNAFLTPDLQPFFGGTYFAPEERWGRAGWPELVEQIGKMWQDPDQRKKIVDSAQNITQHLQSELQKITEPGGLDLSCLNTGFKMFEMDYDSKLGGFGGAPKFPMPVYHRFLLHYAVSAKESGKSSPSADQALKMSVHTLRAMFNGGIYDQIGGGFHRYSTDERWHVPHFEKMLYDNAQLAVVYLMAYQLTYDPEFSRVARETLDYVLRDMTHQDGGFYSAEDADSLPPELAGNPAIAGHEHKAEGAFYIWEKKEILSLLGSESGEILSYYYGIEENGNAVSDPMGEFKNKNVLYLAHSVQDTAKHFNKTEEDIKKIFAQSKQKLFDARTKRPRPHLDDKILTSWNGLMISAFAYGYAVLGESKYLKAAEKAAQFIQKNLYNAKNRRLHRRWRANETKINATADDYAFLIQGLLDLYEAGFDVHWMEWAVELSEIMNEKFFDVHSGGFFMTESAHDKHLILRVKEDYDNVEPSAGSVAALNLLRLAQFTGRKDFRETAEKTLKSHAAQLARQPRSLPQMLVALSFALSKPKQVIIVGNPVSPDTQAMIHEAHSRFIPVRILMLLDSAEAQKKMTRFLPFVEGLKPLEGKATAYVCENYACKLPTNDLKVFMEILDGKK